MDISTKGQLEELRAKKTIELLEKQRADFKAVLEELDECIDCLFVHVDKKKTELVNKELKNAINACLLAKSSIAAEAVLLGYDFCI